MILKQAGELQYLVEDTYKSLKPFLVRIQGTAQVWNATETHCKGMINLTQADAA